MIFDINTGVAGKGAVDGIRNGADEIGGGPENLTNVRLETKGG
ncbi:MAG: hypothetical protein WAV09_04720 [Minisyncoccia bacterium]